MTRDSDRDKGGPAGLPNIVRAGLAWLDRRSAALYGRRFAEAEPRQQTALLARLAAERAAMTGAGRPDVG